MGQFQPVAGPSQDEFDELVADIGNHDLGSFSTLASMESALSALLATMSVGEERNIQIALTADLSPFMGTTYFGKLKKAQNSNHLCEFRTVLDNTEIYGRYRTSGAKWYWDNPFSYLSDRIANCFAVEWKSKDSLTIPAGTTADAQITTTKEGYTFIGILGWIINSGGNSCTVHARYYDANTAVVRVLNLTNASITTGSIQVRCLYVKTGSGILA